MTVATWLGRCKRTLLQPAAVNGSATEQMKESVYVCVR